MEELQEQIDAIQKILASLRNDTTIPKEIGDAFAKRLSTSLAQLTSSATSPTAHNKTVIEAGTSTYAVMDKPTGFLKVVINGQSRDIPYF